MKSESATGASEIPRRDPRERDSFEGARILAPQSRILRDCRRTVERWVTSSEARRTSERLFPVKSRSKCPMRAFPESVVGRPMHYCLTEGQRGSSRAKEASSREREKIPLCFVSGQNPSRRRREVYEPVASRSSILRSFLWLSKPRSGAESEASTGTLRTSSDRRGVGNENPEKTRIRLEWRRHCFS
jgi:hypothetical protein